MHLADMLKYFNRIGVRVVNDVTAQVTAEVTVAMDPDGMGVHMGSEAPSAHIEMATKADLAAQESNFVTKADFGDEMKGWQHALVAACGMVTDKSMDVIMHKVVELTAYADKHAANLAVRMDDKMGQEEERVDKNMADLEQNVTARHNKQCRVVDAKNNHNEATIKEIESKTLGNEATIKDLESKNIDNEATMKDLESKTDKRINIIKKKMRSQNEEHDAKDAERNAKDQARDAKDKERDAKDKERDKLIASLQRDCSKEQKRPADNQGEGTSQKKKRKTEPTYIFKDTSSNGFMWKRYFNGRMRTKKNFNTIEEAVKDMAEYFENLAPQDTAANDLD